MRKPGAFARYVYREEMFPSVIFRRAYDAIQAAQPGTKGDLEYLRILHLAASTIEADVEQRSRRCWRTGRPVTADAVKGRCAQTASAAAPSACARRPRPSTSTAYDALLAEVAA